MDIENSSAGTASENPLFPPVSATTDTSDAASTKAASGDPWLPESLKGNEFLSGYASADEALKELADLKQARATGNMSDFIKLSDDPADLAKVYAKLGRPEAADKYEYAKPETLPEERAPAKEQLEAFNKIAHDANLTQKQYEAVMGHYNQLAEAQEVQAEDRLAANMQELEKRWGSAESPTFKMNQKMAVAGYNALQDPFVLEYAKNNPEWATNPATIEVLAHFGRNMQSDDPAKTTTSESRTFSGNASVENEIVAFKKQYRGALDSPNHPENARRYNELVGLYAKKANVKNM